MSRKRIFIAIALPAKICQEIYDLRLQWPELPCRWTKPHNLHLTVIPPMYLDDNQILNLAAALHKGLIGFQPFTLRLTRIVYGPPGKPIRMIWIKGAPSAELVALQRRIQDIILGIGDMPFREETRPLMPHITASRIVSKLRGATSALPHIDEPFEAEIPVKSVELMESQLKRGGAEYIILESIPLTP